MARNQIHVDAPPEEVFDTWLDAASYPAWVAGTKRLTRVSQGWPAPGSAFWISFAGGLREDRTDLVDLVPSRRIVLKPHVRPFGTTIVELELEASNGGTKVTMVETLQEPSRPQIVTRIADLFLYLRNVEALRRFKKLVQA